MKTRTNELTVIEAEILAYLERGKPAPVSSSYVKAWGDLRARGYVSLRTITPSGLAAIKARRVHASQCSAEAYDKKGA